MASELQVAEEHICELPQGWDVYQVTEDGHPYGVWQREGRLNFVWDGVVGEAFDSVAKQRDGTAESLSDDGNHVAYVGVRSGRGFVGRDGAEDAEVDNFSRSVPPVFSADGGHLAYGAEVDGAYRLILDGVPVSQSQLAPIAAVFSDHGSRFAYVEASDADPKAKFRIVLDGVPGPWFRGMRNARGAMQFSPDGRRFAYYQVDEKGNAHWVVDDVAQPSFSDVRPIGLAQLRGVGVLDAALVARFSPDGSRFAYGADIEGKGVALIEDGQPGPRVKACGSPVFSADGRRLAYAVETLRGHGAVVVDGQMGPELPQVRREPVFSHDGRRVAVSATRKEGGLLRKRKVNSLVVDGEVVVEQEGVDCGGSAVFSPDSQHVAWWVAGTKDRAGAQMFLDGRPVGGPDALSDPFFSATGQLIFAQHDGQATVVVDGQPGPRALGFLNPMGTLPRPLRATPSQLRLSVDGQHVAWAGWFGDRAEDSSARPVLDGRVGPAYEQIFNWSFEPDGAATWWARRGRSMVRVRAAP